MTNQFMLSRDVIIIAEEYLSNTSEIMAKLIAKYGSCPIGNREYQPFETLATSIISQQLSAKAANAIESRVMAILPSFTPAGFLTIPPEILRGAGLSSAKVRCIIELAQRINDGRINFDKLLRHTDDDVIATLIELPGIGRWTAEMFLIFGLKRSDVLSLGDAGLQRSARLLYGENVNLESAALSWRPYRSVASWYLWRHIDN